MPDKSNLSITIFNFSHQKINIAILFVYSIDLFFGRHYTSGVVKTDLFFGGYMTVQTNQEIKFSAGLVDFIYEWKKKPGNLIMILHKVQEELGFIPREAAFQVAKMLDIPLAKIYGVVTFYHLFKLNKPGRHNIQVCLGTACYLKGGQDIIDELEEILGVSINSVTEDGEFSIEAVRCVGCCGLAPVMVIGGEVYGKLSKDKLPGIIAKYREK